MTTLAESVATGPATLSVRQLSASAQDLLVSRTRGLNQLERDEVIRQLTNADGFAGSDVFERLVAEASVSLRQHLWDACVGTLAQAERAYETETSPYVRATMVVRYDLGPERTVAALKIGDVVNAPVVWDALRRLGWSCPVTRERIPMSVWVRAVTSREYVSSAEELIVEWGALAVAIAEAPDAPTQWRVSACVNSAVSASTVVRVIQSLRGAEEDAQVTGGLEALVRYRPVMTAPEAVAVRDVVGQWTPILVEEVVEALAARAGWELSGSEFGRRAGAASDPESLLGLIESVPAAVWPLLEYEHVREVYASEHATVKVMRTLMELPTVLAVAPLEFWHPTAEVFDHQDLLAMCVKRADGESEPAFDDSVRAGWLEVLRGPRATEFTTWAAAEPGRVDDAVWTSAMCWDGDLDALALNVPAALATKVGSGDLLASVLNVIAEADPAGALLALFESHHGEPGALTVRDLIEAHAAAKSATGHDC